jgi:hypothetical protein
VEETTKRGQYPNYAQIYKKLKLEAEHSVLLYLNYNMYVVVLAQLVRFLVMKLIHPDSILRFDICVPFTANYSFSGRRRLHRQ